MVDLVGNANIPSSKRQRIRTSRHSKSIENLKKSHLPVIRLRSGTCQPTPGRFNVDVTADDLSATLGIPRVTEKKRKINRKPNMSRIYTCAPSLHHDAEPVGRFHRQPTYVLHTYIDIFGSILLMVGPGSE